jgi:hypothetical protein
LRLIGTSPPSTLIGTSSIAVVVVGAGAGAIASPFNSRSDKTSSLGSVSVSWRSFLASTATVADENITAIVARTRSVARSALFALAFAFFLHVLNSANGFRVEDMSMLLLFLSFIDVEKFLTISKQFVKKYAQ